MAHVDDLPAVWDSLIEQLWMHKASAPHGLHGSLQLIMLESTCKGSVAGSGSSKGDASHLQQERCSALESRICACSADF